MSVKRTSTQRDQDVGNITVLLRFQFSFFDLNFWKSHLAVILLKRIRHGVDQFQSLFNVLNYEAVCNVLKDHHFYGTVNINSSN